MRKRIGLLSRIGRYRQHNRLRAAAQQHGKEDGRVVNPPLTLAKALYPDAPIHSNSEAAPVLALGNQVMITRSLFSRRTRGGCDSGRNCACEVLEVGK